MSADRNFLSHKLARDVLATGAHILWRASASFALAPIKTLAEGHLRLKPARHRAGFSSSCVGSAGIADRWPRKPILPG